MFSVCFLGVCVFSLFSAPFFFFFRSGGLPPPPSVFEKCRTMERVGCHWGISIDTSPLRPNFACEVQSLHSVALHLASGQGPPPCGGLDIRFLVLLIQFFVLMIQFLVLQLSERT